MRQGQQNRRGRGRGRKVQNPLSRNYESNGPDVKIRGNASHIAEKYSALARDALAAGDTVTAENFLQHAEHYYRIIMAAQSQQNQQNQQNPGSPQPDVTNGSGGNRAEAETTAEAEAAQPEGAANGKPAEAKPAEAKPAESEAPAASAEASEPEAPARKPRANGKAAKKAETSAKSEASAKAEAGAETEAGAEADPAAADEPSSDNAAA